MPVAHSFSVCLDRADRRRDGPAAVPGRTGRHVPPVDQSQRSRLRDRPPEMDLRVSVPAAALRHIRRVLLCARVAHLQDVLCAQTARSARARHPATGELSSSSSSSSDSVVCTVE